MKFWKKILIWVAVIGVAYLLLGFHYIVIGKSVKMLKKSKFTLSYTFFSTDGKRNATILAIDDLREDGIGKLLVKTGRMRPAELERIMAKYGVEEEEEDY